MKLLVVLQLLLLLPLSNFAQSDSSNDLDKLIRATLNETPIVEDLHELCDEIGGRITGTLANEKSVEWVTQKFEEAGVKTWTEDFEMPRKWKENAVFAHVSGATHFHPKMTARAFSTATSENGLSGDLVFVGKGRKKDFEKVKDRVKGNIILVQTPLMTSLTQLFLEYIDAIEIEGNAREYGASAIVYMSSRAKKLLYRHLTAYGIYNDMPVAVMARDDATRCKRLLKRGKPLTMNLVVDVLDGGAYQSTNVFGEITGTEHPEEIILMGAHLDSWGLGTGANDNGCNVSMMIDIARQMTALGLRPRRTIRFALWNGEEQGMFGSYAYTQQHKNELDDHKLAGSIDIGSGKINGFFMNGNSDLLPFLTQFTQAVDSLGPFEHTDASIIGTDNYDFFVQGVPNIVGKHHTYNYCADYHSESDTFDKVNVQNLKENTALVAAILWQFANLEEWPLQRWDRKQVREVIGDQELKEGMKALNLWKGWMDGSRGVE